MVLILDGSSEHVPHVSNKIDNFREKNEIDDAVDVTECLYQIEMPLLIYTRAPCSELPSNISTVL